MFCWKCQKEIGIFGKVSFRATCESCGSDLHTCKQCKFYCPGKPNDCLVPGTDFIADREKSNLCEEFSPRQDKNTPSGPSRSDIEKRLFG